MVPGRQRHTQCRLKHGAQQSEKDRHIEASGRHTDTWKHHRDTQIVDRMAHLASEGDQRRSSPESEHCIAQHAGWAHCSCTLTDTCISRQMKNASKSVEGCSHPDHKGCLVPGCPLRQAYAGLQGACIGHLGHIAGEGASAACQGSCCCCITARLHLLHLLLGLGGLDGLATPVVPTQVRGSHHHWQQLINQLHREEIGNSSSINCTEREMRM